MGGRLGDNLITYYKAKWLAYKYDLEFYYKPFKLSKGLELHDIELRYSDDILSKFYYLEKLDKKKECNVTIDKSAGVLYESSYYFVPDEWNNITGEGNSFFIEDTEFLSLLRQLVRPKRNLKPIHKPNDMLTVAVHVRKGSGNDSKLVSGKVPFGSQRKGADTKFPLKFPPDQYYIDQIVRLSEMFDNSMIYIHIFTDDKYPKKIVERYKSIIDKNNILWGCREKQNSGELNVLEDFFGLLNFDCLIRPRSSFSQAAEWLNDFKVVMYPSHAEWLNSEGMAVLVVDKVAMISYDALIRLSTDKYQKILSTSPSFSSLRIDINVEPFFDVSI